MNNIKEICYNKMTDKNGLGDFVKCCNCGKLMLVNIGLENCPECEADCLSWVDYAHELDGDMITEATVEDVEKLGYVVE